MKEYQVINILEGIYEEYVRDNDKDYMERNTALTEAVKALTEIQYYRAIGTVEECQEARERQRGKKPILSAPCKSINYYLCPNCNKILNINKPFCCDCGSGIDWSEEDV